jgi:hypothetical protein
MADGLEDDNTLKEKLNNRNKDEKVKPKDFGMREEWNDEEFLRIPSFQYSIIPKQLH